MNSDPEKLRILLEEVLPTSIEPGGPSSAEVLNMVRNERQRRRCQHSAALLAIMVVAAGVALWTREPAVVAPVVQAPVKPAPIVIHRVNDEQLFALLEETPAALMELPNGGRRLLLIEQ